MLYGKEINIFLIGIYFIGFVVMILIIRFFVGKIFDEKGYVVIIIFSVIFLIIGFIILLYVNFIFMFVVLFLFYGFGYGVV